MATRKPGKKVIDHDPLAWLGEDMESVQESTSDVNETSELDCDKKLQQASKPDNSESAGALSLGESLTIKNVADFKKQVTEALAQNSEISLESTGLQKIDTAGLQLLYSLQQNLAVSQRSINWIDLNPVINSAARLTGLTEIVEGISAGFGFFDDPVPEPESKAVADQGFGFF